MRTSCTRNRVIVDENAGPGTRLWDAFQRAVGDVQIEYVFLSEEHRGIPDVEILDKLLGPDAALLTGDCVLHMRALERGYRSYTLNQQGQLTRKRLPHVRRLKPLPKSVHSDLHADYSGQREHDFARRFKTSFSERQLKRYRTAHRRIRSHFGSAAAISQVSVTVGSLETSRGPVCGFVFHVAGNSGVKGLRASEGYCRVTEVDQQNPAWPGLHALRDLYLLQLHHVPTDLFIIPPRSLKLTQQLYDSHQPVSEPSHEAVRQLMLELPKLTLHPCTKGRFYEAMQSKLKRLARNQSNELTTLNLDMIANQFLDTDRNDSISSEV